MQVEARMQAEERIHRPAAEPNSDAAGPADQQTEAVADGMTVSACEFHNMVGGSPTSQKVLL